MHASLFCDALNAAMMTRGLPKGVMIHSDRGSQYCSKKFRKLVVQYGMTQSMSRKGNCWDNAVAESFFLLLSEQLFIRSLCKLIFKQNKTYLSSLKCITIGFAGTQQITGSHQLNSKACITKS